MRSVALRCALGLLVATPACQSSSSAGPCTAPLEQARAYWGVRCPDNYPGIAGLSGACADPLPMWTMVSAGRCGGLAAVAYDWGSHWQLCTYGGADAGSLVGALVEEDINAFCDQSAYLLSAGQVPMSCDPSALTLVVTCSPGDGASDAAVNATGGG